MLHLPMEPVEYPDINSGPGTLHTRMGPEELLRVLEEDLDAVPHIKGVNNHMGSRLTASSEQMYQVFSVLKKRGLYFVDSRTTDESICQPSARLFQLPFAQRDVFMDHQQDPAFIRKQIRELVRDRPPQGRGGGHRPPPPGHLRHPQGRAPGAAPAGGDRARLGAGPAGRVESLFQVTRQRDEYSERMRAPHLREENAPFMSDR
ncbi:MAG: divergent polysaccharide deacetylase family protein [Desulfobacterales bacterium]|nr:divergent polysaccharide deacetylase family protein [Desulfobacterales bacterium]